MEVFNSLSHIHLTSLRFCLEKFAQTARYFHIAPSMGTMTYGSPPSS